MTLRWYQTEAVTAVWRSIRQHNDNPVVVLPTGSGKSHVIAQLARESLDRWNARVVMVTHRKELIAQNADKIRALLPGNTVGIYSAGLGSRDTEHDVLCCGIQSVYQRAAEIGRRELILIDEAHLIPHDGEGMYRQFLAELKAYNPKSRCVGLTATPYRTGQGSICRSNAIFQRICYEAPIGRLIDEGFLCRLTNSVTHGGISTGGLHFRGGEFLQPEMEARFSHDVTRAACLEILELTRDRRSVLVFCASVDKANFTRDMLENLSSEQVGLVTGETLPIERDSTLLAFREQRLRICCNVDVLTTGFDHPGIDAIAILRATASPGLYCQIVGRGLRTAPGKPDCLILDYGENIQRHGPIDAIDYGRRAARGITGTEPTKCCVACQELLPLSARVCDECGYEFERKEKRHEPTADQESQIISEPEEFLVIERSAAKHVKRGIENIDKPPTLRVDYKVYRPTEPEPKPMLATTISEWVCFEHDGWARKKAVGWWRERSLAHPPETVDEAIDLIRQGATVTPSKIVARREGKFWRIVRAVFTDELPTDWESGDSLSIDIPEFLADQEPAF